jgi:alcohol dehydrogenase class IV
LSYLQENHEVRLPRQFSSFCIEVPVVCRFGDHARRGSVEGDGFHVEPSSLPQAIHRGCAEAFGKALGASGIEAADAFAEFTNKTGLPGRLADFGIGEDKFDQISKIAINRRFVRANPRPFKTEAETIDLLRMAA